MKVKIFVCALLTGLLFLGCEKNTPLTPARQLEGTWTTPNPVTFYFDSDGCGSYGHYSKFTMKVSWQVTARGDSMVDITETLISSTVQTSVGSNCGLPAPALAFPLQFVGVITGSKFALDEQQMLYSSSGAALGLGNVRIGIFNFTSNNITGSVDERDCPAYCSGYSTDANTFILTKN